jgi:hypothetical protein
MGTKVEYVVEYASALWPDGSRKLYWRTHSGPYRHLADAQRAYEFAQADDFLGHHYRVCQVVTVSVVIAGPIKIDHG